MDIRVQPNSNSCASFQICVPVQAEVTCASGVQLDLDADGDFSSTPAGGEDFKEVTHHMSGFQHPAQAGVPVSNGECGPLPAPMSTCSSHEVNDLGGFGIGMRGAWGMWATPLQIAHPKTVILKPPIVRQVLPLT
jgi:hypothetical protein